MGVRPDALQAVDILDVRDFRVRHDCRVRLNAKFCHETKIYKELEWIYR